MEGDRKIEDSWKKKSITISGATGCSTTVPERGVLVRGRGDTVVHVGVQSMFSVRRECPMYRRAVLGDGGRGGQCGNRPLALSLIPSIPDVILTPHACPHETRGQVLRCEFRGTLSELMMLMKIQTITAPRITIG